MGVCLCLQCSVLCTGGSSEISLSLLYLSAFIFRSGKSMCFCNSAVHLHKMQAPCQINLMLEAKPWSTSTRHDVTLTCRVYISWAVSYTHFSFVAVTKHVWYVVHKFPSAIALCLSLAPIISRELRELSDPAGSFGPQPILCSWFYWMAVYSAAVCHLDVFPSYWR